MNNHSNVTQNQSLARSTDGVYASATFEHMFEEVGSETNDEDAQVQAETKPHPLTAEAVSGAVNPALGEALTPMQSANITAEIVTATVEEALADILSDATVLAGHRVISARIVAAVMAAPLHAADRSQHADLLRFACGDTTNPFVSAFFDDVCNIVEDWSLFIPGVEWAPFVGGIDFDQMHLSVPVWQNTVSGAVMFDLIEPDHPDTLEQSRRHGREVTALHRRGRKRFGRAFTGIRCITTSDISQSRWLMRWGTHDFPPMRLLDILGADNGIAR